MFSIIIPLYNKAKYVEKAIKSILSQTCSEYEIIVIDDGSTDNGFEVAELALIGVDETVLIKQKNSGVSTARNYGVSLAKYEYIAFLDADDWWEPTFLEEMKTLIDEYSDAGIWGCGFYSVRYGHKTIIPLGVPSNFKKGYANYAKLLSQGNCRPICTGSNIIKKETFKIIGGFSSKLKLGEDFDLFFRVYLSSSLVLLDKPLFNYNNDVDPNNRAIGIRLYPKEETVFWNLNYAEQNTNKEVKHLVEFLKLRSLYPYYLAGRYLNDIKQELKNIDFSRHQKIFIWRYKIIPRWSLVLRNDIMKMVSKLKQKLRQW